MVCGAIGLSHFVHLVAADETFNTIVTVDTSESRKKDNYRKLAIRRNSRFMSDTAWFTDKVAGIDGTPFIRETTLEYVYKRITEMMVRWRLLSWIHLDKCDCHADRTVDV